MLVRLSPLLRCSASTELDTHWRIADFLLEANLSFLRYVLVRPESEAGGSEIPVPISAVAAPTRGENELSIGLSNDELRELSTVTPEPTLSRKNEIRLHELIHWRPYWPPENDQAEPNLRPFQQALGMSAQCDSVSVGTVRDLFVDGYDWRVRVIELQAEMEDTASIFSVPRHSVRSVDWSNRAVSLATTRERIVSAPQSKGRDVLDAVDVDAILGHF